MDKQMLDGKVAIITGAVMEWGRQWQNCLLRKALALC